MYHSLMHRLPPSEPGLKPVLNEIQPDIHPFEVLFDVTKLMQLENVATFVGFHCLITD
jgi:anaphase-promoting complex subunit 5